MGAKQTIGYFLLLGLLFCATAPVYATEAHSHKSSVSVTFDGDATDTEEPDRQVDWSSPNETDKVQIFNPNLPAKTVDLPKTGGNRTLATLFIGASAVFLTCAAIAIERARPPKETYLFTRHRNPR